MTRLTVIHKLIVPIPVWSNWSVGIFYLYTKYVWKQRSQPSTKLENGVRFHSLILISSFWSLGAALLVTSAPALTVMSICVWGYGRSGCNVEHKKKFGTPTSLGLSNQVTPGLLADFQSLWKCQDGEESHLDFSHRSAVTVKAQRGSGGEGNYVQPCLQWSWPTYALFKIKWMS